MVFVFPNYQERAAWSLYTLLCLKDAERMNEELYLSLPPILAYLTLEAISLKFTLRTALSLRYQSLKCESFVYSLHRSISEMIIKKQRIPLKSFVSFGFHDEDYQHQQNYYKGTYNCL